MYAHLRFVGSFALYKGNRHLLDVKRDARPMVQSARSVHPHLLHLPTSHSIQSCARCNAASVASDQGFEIQTRVDYQAVVGAQAVEAYLQSSGALPISVKFLLEGQEEVGSPNLDAALQQHAALLACDYAIRRAAHICCSSPPACRCEICVAWHFLANAVSGFLQVAAQCIRYCVAPPSSQLSILTVN